MPNLLTRLRMLIFVPIIGITLAAWALPASAEELRILAWQGYADDDWVAQFETETGVKVNVVYPAADDEIWAKIKGSEGQDFDLITVNTAQLQRYIDAKLVQPYDMDKLPNQKLVLPRFRDLSKVTGVMRDGNVYAIPFAYDSMGLIYDKNKVVPAPTSNLEMWNPKYKGKVLVFDFGEHNISLTALALGYKDPFHLTPEQLDTIKAKLIELKHNMLSFYATADEATQMYKNNDVALIWGNYASQQVKMLKDAGANIASITPKEGALAWLDTYAISIGAKDKDLAEKWVNFVLQKQIGEQLSSREGFGNTLTGGIEMNDNDKIIWLEPVEDPLKRSDIWNEVKAAP